jgi:energy-coupling factor transporter ATP-binding protein EcfA2
MGILEVKGVNKSFGGLKALHEVNLDIEEGKVHAIIGPNGAGKSTLLNTLIGKAGTRYRIGDVRRQSLHRDAAAPRSTRWCQSRVPDARNLRRPDLLENVMIPPLQSATGSFICHRTAGQAWRGIRNFTIRPMGRWKMWDWPAKATFHRRPAVARRQAPAGTGHVPDPGPQACCCWTSRPPAWRAPTPMHHRPAQADQGRRHDEGGHRARHARGVLAGRPDQRAGARRIHREGKPRKSRVIRRSGSLSRGANRYERCSSCGKTGLAAMRPGSRPSRQPA